MNKTREHFANWRANPRRWEIAYVASRIKTLLQGRSAERSRKRAADAANQLLNPAIECEYVDLLFDPEFQRSVTQVKDYSCLDVVRLGESLDHSSIDRAGNIRRSWHVQGRDGAAHLQRNGESRLGFLLF